MRALDLVDPGPGARGDVGHQNAGMDGLQFLEQALQHDPACTSPDDRILSLDNAIATINARI